MNLVSTLSHPGRPPLSAADARAVIDIARRLRDAEAAGAPQALLKGKHLALLCPDAACVAAQHFADAATGLGARVSRLDPETLKIAGEPTARDAVALLARLYDAVECDHVNEGLAERLRRTTGLLVFDGIADDSHPLMQLAVQAGAPEPDERRRLVQALLVHRLA
jgi:ornithine carbamoyltransferase